MTRETQALGRAGEYLAASIFEQHGIITTHVDVYGSDLWCKTPSGRMVSVQVKTTLRIGSEGARHPTRYSFNLRWRPEWAADVYCLVALEDRLFRLFSAAEMPKSSTKRVSKGRMTEELMLEDLKRYLY